VRHKRAVLRTAAGKPGWIRVLGRIQCTPPPLFLPGTRILPENADIRDQVVLVR
jgi:hypothetical protein